MQADSRWWLVNLNNTTSVEYTLWYRGCALTAAATAFSSRGIRLPDVGTVEAIARRKHAAAAAHLNSPGVTRPLAAHGVTDFGAINPLTLDAWMTGGGSRGFVNAASAELSWNKIASLSSRIMFGAWLEPKDQRYPSPAVLRGWLNGATCVIGNVHGGDHFVVLTGYRGETEFLAFDVGYAVDAARPDRHHGSDTYFAFSDFVLMITYTFGP